MKLEFNHSFGWQLCFGIAWHSGKEFGGWPFVTVWVGPWVCSVHKAELPPDLKEFVAKHPSLHPDAFKK